jgi:hypothetical protein
MVDIGVMAQTCSKCSRANPAEAVYCYFDGMVLGGHGRNGGPVSVSTQPFHSQFVFPSGRQCRNFDELALACQENWCEARDLLQQGYLQSFLGTLGRADLALAAREAARFPDKDRGLDQLLTKLPSHVLDAPKLRVEPLEVSLGTMQPGQERQLQLHLHNQGMRLLYGTIASEDCPWLALGDAQASPQKVFQFDSEMIIPVHVRGKQLRAGNKPLEGKLLVESNGGTAVVVVRVEVPVKPFPDGVLAGAKSPRQIAEKAKAHPKEAAVLFEKGAVADWYKENGWTYPVQGPAASGLGAVQQFFEALGLTPPPRVTISERSVGLRGDPGQSLRHVLRMESQERRPVYAHGTSNQPWLEVGRPNLNGRHASISLSIPSVPNKPGETLNAKVLVQANGNQRFVVPITLVIGGTPVGGGSVFSFVDPEPAAVTVFPETVFPEAVPVAAASVPVAAPAAAFDGIPAAQPSRYRSHGPSWVHAVPLLLLFLVLAGVVAWDVLRKPADQQQGGTPPPSPAGEDDLDPWVFHVTDSEPKLDVEFSDRMRFGVMMHGVPDPRPEYHDKSKRLTYEEQGLSNNTIVKIDGSEYYFGTTTPTSKWVKKKVKIDKKGRHGWVSIMDFNREKVRVTQHVEIVPGSTGLLDTLLIYYTIENRSDAPHKVGIRVMMDTYIGANDGVPFTIPGEKGFLDTMREFSQKEIPDYIEAIEKPDDPKDHGTVARMGLKVSLPKVDLEPIERMLICRWPGNKETGWDWEPTAMNDPPDKAKDSCVALYWAYRNMNAEETRRMAFTYGLGDISIGGVSLGGGLAISVPNSVRADSEFVATAYVYNAKDDQKVKLILPDTGLTLAEGETAEKTIETPGKRTQVFWKLRAGKAGKYKLEAASGRVKAPPRQVNVNSSSIFD